MKGESSCVSWPVWTKALCGTLKQYNEIGPCKKVSTHQIYQEIGIPQAYLQFNAYTYVNVHMCVRGGEWGLSFVQRREEENNTHTWRTWSCNKICVEKSTDSSDCEIVMSLKNIDWEQHGPTRSYNEIRIRKRTKATSERCGRTRSCNEVGKGKHTVVSTMISEYNYKISTSIWTKAWLIKSYNEMRMLKQVTMKFLEQQSLAFSSINDYQTMWPFNFLEFLRMNNVAKS